MLFALALLVPQAQAVSFGVTGMGGAVFTLHQSSGDVDLDSMAGPLAELGVELGSRFISSFLAQYTAVNGDISAGEVVAGTVDLQTAAFGYRFTFDLFGRDGKHRASPYIGTGLLIGSVHLFESVAATDPDVLAEAGVPPTYSVDDHRVLLELHAVVGAHYRITDHLGARAEVGLSSYGGVVGVQPALGVYAMW